MNEPSATEDLPDRRAALAADAQTQSAYPWLPLAPQAEVNAVSGG
jgi:hypothetical protein